ncbi:uncharacterized [Tachysurus ichikawai]
MPAKSSGPALVIRSLALASTGQNGASSDTMQARVSVFNEHIVGLNRTPWLCEARSYPSVIPPILSEAAGTSRTLHRTQSSSLISP